MSLSDYDDLTCGVGAGEPSTYTWQQPRLKKVTASSKRELYKMKRKTKGLQIKVAVDDKKVSQVMSRAARLNDAFSVVKHVPVIRPSLPAIGMTTWPAMSIR